MANAPKPRKVLGQHWLTRPELAQAIAGYLQHAETFPDLDLLEVGPGPGPLTEALVAKPFRRLFLVEKDEALAATLRERFAGDGRVRVVDADILTWEWPQDFHGAVAANLPYYLTGKFLRLLYWKMGPVTQAVLLVQREVAQRLAAPMGDTNRSKPTVLMDAVAQVSLKRVVKPGAFHPPPKVDSAVVHLGAREGLSDTNWREALEQVVNCAFSQRRKKAMPLLLKGLPQLQGREEAFMSTFRHVSEARAQAISTADFLAMARWVMEQTP